MARRNVEPETLRVLWLGTDNECCPPHPACDHELPAADARALVAAYPKHYATADAPPVADPEPQPEPAA